MVGFETTFGFGDLPPPRETTGESFEEDVEDVTNYRLTPDDTVIAVMGVTGVGKSTFISYFSPDAQIGEGLQSETSRVETHEAHIGHKKIYLIDTPGFDDTTLSDVDVLRMLADWLNHTYRAGIRLAGIIYLHRITDTRVGGSAMKNLRMFRKLCGPDALASVVLATTMWGTVPHEVALQREQQLVLRDDFWGGMVRHGSTVLRQNDGVRSATDIIQHIIQKRNSQWGGAGAGGSGRGSSSSSRGEGGRGATLDIQAEMARGVTLDHTAAGREVSAESERMRARHEQEMRQLKEEWQEAMKARDVEAQRELDAVRRELEDKMRQEREGVKRLEVDMGQLQRQRAEERLRENEEMHARALEVERDLQRQRGEVDKMRAVGRLERDLAVAELERKLARAHERTAKLELRNERARRKRHERRHHQSRYGHSSSRRRYGC